MTTQDLRLETALADLAALITRFTAAEGANPTAIPGLTFYRASAPSGFHHGVQNPCVCVIAQGAKRVLLGEEVFRYDRARYLAASMNLPISGQVVEASPAKPYLSMKFDVTPQEIAALILEARLPEANGTAPSRGIFVSRIDTALIEAFVRLARLLDNPEDIPALAAGARREILYRMLKGDEGHRLRQIAASSAHAARIAKAIEWLRQNYSKPLRIEDLAGHASMSTSSFHEHFRAVTAMSPLQFQKQLRLQHARQLLISEALAAATAGHRVGYESPSQFSREYSRLFGAPPAADRKRLASAGEAV